MFHVAIRNRKAVIKQAQPQAVSQTLHAGTQRHLVRDRLLNYRVRSAWTPPDVRMQELHACAWGQTTAKAIDKWMRALRWPDSDNQHPDQHLGTSWYEMVLSFMISEQMFLPIKRTTAGGIERLIPFKDSASLVAYGIKFSELVNAFSQVCKQVCDLQDPSPLPTCERGLIRSMYVQGAAVFTSGYKTRVQLPCQDQVITILHTYLGIHKGPAFQTVPELPVQCDETRFLAVTRELQQSWHSKCSMTMKAVKKVQQWKNNRQNPLRF